MILVSSGVIGIESRKLNLKSMPTDMTTMQATATVGQYELMYTYHKLFLDCNYTVG